MAVQKHNDDRGNRSDQIKTKYAFRDHSFFRSLIQRIQEYFYWDSDRKWTENALDSVYLILKKKTEFTMASSTAKKEKMESFFSENKKVSNRLIKEELGIILEYPSYKEGYNQIINLNN